MRRGDGTGGRIGVRKEREDKLRKWREDKKEEAAHVWWLDHLGAMCSRAWCALCAVGSRFKSSHSPGKARPPT